LEELRVPKRRVLAQIVLPGGEAREVAVFLAEAVPGSGAPERLSDLLNGETKFIPAMDAATEAMTFVHSVAIAVARVESRHELRDVDQLTILTEHEVEIRLVDGQRLQGLITYVQPEDRSRLTDYLNEAPSFLRLLQGDRVALVNKRHVAYVESLSR
jgi:hypothetical protein